MADWTSERERKQFAGRLAQALREAGVIDNVSEIARQYKRHTTASISMHAFRKWMRGESIPRQAHLSGLSDWLQCDTSWLRYGTETPVEATEASPSLQDMVLLRDLSQLDERSKLLARNLIDILTNLHLAGRHEAGVLTTETYRGL